MIIVFDIGSAADWAAVIVSLLALIFAGLGYKQLIDGQDDIKEQVKAANQTADSMRIMAANFLKAEDARRQHLKPIFRISKTSPPIVENGGQLLTVSLFNIGNSSAKNVNVYSDSDALRLLTPRWDIISSRDSCKIQLKGDINNYLGTEDEPCTISIWLTDTYGNRYLQEITLYFTENHDLISNICLPFEPGPEHEPVTEYDGS